MATELPSEAFPFEDSAAHPQSAELLQRCLRRSLRRHIETAGYAASLTVVGFRGRHIDVLRSKIERPEDAVLGFVLPPDYDAIGVLASSVVAAPPKRVHRDAALALGANRTGDVVSFVATADAVIDTREPHGWLIDACLRAVGRETTPCTTASLAFPIALWLDRLMVAILNTPVGRPVTWADAVDLCPVPHRWRSKDPIDLGTTLGSTTRSWKAVRSACAHGADTATGVLPEHAGWMDDAMFARWCIGSFPDLSSLRSDVEFLASPEVAEHIELTVRAAWLAFTG